jgi:hypothetical protein
MWQSDLTFEEQYECWMKVMDDQATSEVVGDMGFWEETFN